MLELNEQQQMIARTVLDFVEREVIPVAGGMEHRDEYPHALVETMKALGLFGLNVPEKFGGSEIDDTAFAIVFEELSRAIVSLPLFAWLSPFLSPQKTSVRNIRYSVVFLRDRAIFQVARS